MRGEGAVDIHDLFGRLYEKLTLLAVICLNLPLLLFTLMLSTSTMLNKLYKSNIDLVAMGHTHVSELSNVKSERGRNKYYMNTGFFRDNGTYGVIDSDSVYIGVFDKKVLLS